ncbi:hypothetical protein [Hoeflea sp.]|uniref:hypothetical protein n=1 Tax=Hoeflea sp. TaxID=1940281 RepID=UPI003B51FD53
MRPHFSSHLSRAESFSRRVGLALGLALLPVGARAHEFDLGGDAYDDFLAGGAAVLNDLPVLLALMSTGILVSLWDRQGLPRVWPAFMVSVIAGFGLAALMPVDPVPLLYGAAIITGLLAAAAVQGTRPIMAGIVSGAGLMTGWGILAGHGWGELPAGVYAGLFALFNLVLAGTSAFASALLTRLPGRWTGIALRALASWLTAIAIMSLAFVLSETG